MAKISVLIPQRDAGSVVAGQIPQVLKALEAISSDYEVIVVDDASGPLSVNALEQLFSDRQQVRILRLAPACGLSAALTAGVAAASGDFVVSLPAGDPSCASLIRSLLDELARLDLVVGRPQRRGFRKAIHRLTRIPRWLVLGLDVRDPECLVWAARREAISGLQLPRGMYRYLATLVSVRGYRVGEITVPTQGRSVRLADGLPNPGDLLFAWWFKRRWRQYERMERAGAEASVGDDPETARNGATLFDSPAEVSPPCSRRLSA